MTAPVRVLRIGIYSGWKVLAAGLVCSGLSIGGTVYVFGLLVLPISSEFNLTRTQMNSGLIALLVGMAVWGALAGRIIDKAPARIVMPIGGLLMSAGAVTIALAESTMTMVLSAVLLLGAGATCGGSLAANAVVSRWFRRRRGRAMGIMALATSAGGFLLPPLMAMLITGYGWRNAVLALGLLVGPLIAISSALFMRDRPDLATLKAAGELGESESPGTAARFAQDEREWSVRDMLRSRNFWLVMIAVALLMGSDQALLSLKVPFYQSQGVSLQAASILLAVQTASAIVGKVSIGFLSERIDVRRIFAAICALHVVALLMFIHWPGYTVMLILLGTLGVAIGGVLPVKLVLIGAVFGSRSFGQVVGAITVAVQAVSILFIYVSGRAFDATGSYDTVFWMFLAGVVVALALVQFVRLPSREDEVDPRMSQAA